MDIKFSGNKIEFKKEVNALDKFVIDFTRILNRLNIRYVIVSGYVSILFGRNRASEDIDLIIEKMNLEEFNKFWEEVTKEFECLNTENKEQAYNEYLMENVAIRFAKKGKSLPNMEVKFPKLDLDSLTLSERKEIKINEDIIFISPFEIQIPFKLFLGSEKDIEDARYLYKLFKEKIKIATLEEFVRKLKIEEEYNKYLR
ncbi:MAG: hypothetical protein Q8R00_01820 [Candidatus Nanoarchaeia archaeon]|nr:hypothetical protein [Candidatus Nanoarchaeia archaeon]